MGELLVFGKGKKRQGLHGLVKVVPAAKLAKDCKVVSFVVMDYGFNAYSLGGYLGTSSRTLMQGAEEPEQAAQEAIDQAGGKGDVQFVAPTPFPKEEISRYYQMDREIDIDLAVELGLGVVRSRGADLLYSPPAYDDPDEDAREETIRLMMYDQLVYPDKRNERLRWHMEEDADEMGFMTLGCSPAGIRHLHRLASILGLSGN